MAYTAPSTPSQPTNTASLLNFLTSLGLLPQAAAAPTTPSVQGTRSTAGDVGAGLSSGLAASLGTPGAYSGLIAGGQPSGGISLQGLLSSLVNPAISSIKGGEATPGLALGPLSYIGSTLGSQVGQQVTSALGLSPAPRGGGGISGLVSGGLSSFLGTDPKSTQGITDTALGLLSVLAGSKFGPAGSLGISGINAAINALQGQNISKDLANMALLGLPSLFSSVPFAGSLISTAVRDPLASLINTLAQQVGLAAPGTLTATGKPSGMGAYLGASMPPAGAMNLTGAWLDLGVPAKDAVALGYSGVAPGMLDTPAGQQAALDAIDPAAGRAGLGTVEAALAGLAANLGLGAFSGSTNIGWGGGPSAEADGDMDFGFDLGGEGFGGWD